MPHSTAVRKDDVPFQQPSFRVLGTRVDAVPLPLATRTVEEWIAQRRRGAFVTLTNVNNVMEAKYNSRFHKVMDSADLSLPDGMPLAWLGKAYGHTHLTRVAGPDFVPSFCAATAGRGYRHFFYGGAEGVADKMARKLQRQAPGMQIAGTYSPPFHALTPDEDEQVVNTINQANADVLWVGLGCPKQEYWIAEHRDRLNVPVILAVGQAFDIHAGVTRRAPWWMRNYGFEWLFRLLAEPRRLWRRYLVSNSQFLLFLALEYCGVRVRQEVGSGASTT